MPAQPLEPTPAQDLPDVDQFIARARALCITTVVIAWREEYGQVPEAPGVVFERLARFSLLAYHKPTSAILRCHQQGDGTVWQALADALRAQGFTVEERTRNEVKYRT